MPTVNCPSCARPLEVDPEYRDWTVRCPHCDHEFVAGDAEPVVPSRRRPAPRDDYDADDDDDRRRRRRRHYDEDDEDDEDDRRGERYPGYDTREEALRLVAGPGMWMEVFGWLHAVLTLAGCLIAFAVAFEGNQPDEGPMCAAFAFAVVGLPCSVLFIISGRNLRTIGSHGWAMAGAIVCVVLLGVFTCLAIFHGVIGIWALVTMEKPEVREAFGLPSRGPRRRRRWD